MAGFDPALNLPVGGVRVVESNVPDPGRISGSGRAMTGTSGAGDPAPVADAPRERFSGKPCPGPAAGQTLTVPGSVWQALLVRSLAEGYTNQSGPGDRPGQEYAGA